MIASLPRGVRKYFDWANYSFSILSIVVPVFLITLPIVWTVEDPPIQQLSFNRSYEGQAGSTLNIPIPLQIQTRIKSVALRIDMVDSQGDVAYEYPDFRTTEEGLNLSDTSIRIPSLRSGVYKIRVLILYPFNPFKTGKIVVHMGDLTVF